MLKLRSGLPQPADLLPHAPPHTPAVDSYASIHLEPQTSCRKNGTVHYEEETLSRHLVLSELANCRPACTAVVPDFP